MLAHYVGHILVALGGVLRTAERKRGGRRDPGVSRKSKELCIESRPEILVPIERGPYGISPQRLKEGDPVINELGLFRQMTAHGVDQAQKRVVIYNRLRGVEPVAGGARVRAIVDHAKAVQFMKSSVPRVELRIVAEVVVHAGYNVISILGIAATRIGRNAILNSPEESGRGPRRKRSTTCSRCRTSRIQSHVRSATVTRYCRIVRPKLPKGREKGLRCRRIRSVDQVLIGDHRLGGSGTPNPGPFGTHEEKELVLLDRAPSGSAKLVPRVDRP